MKFLRFLTGSAPRLSIIVIVYNMRREAPRTLFSLSADYQEGIDSDDYEVIVVENGSSEPLDPGTVSSFGTNFRYHFVENAQPSPAAAINLGVAMSKAEFVGVMIDGARIASPGMVSLALKALTSFPRCIVGSIGYHLGPDIQKRSIEHGYSQTVEDKLLDGSNWRKQGYNLFQISVLAGSSMGGWVDRISESNLIFLPRTIYRHLGGFDERFDFPGGGLVNSDFYRRACDLDYAELITLFGEATFHQIHGGTITNMPSAEVHIEFQTYLAQYEQLRGVPFKNSDRMPLLFGRSRRQILKSLEETCELVLQNQQKPPGPQQ